MDAATTTEVFLKDTSSYSMHQYGMVLLCSWNNKAKQNK
jgi:hypothetical protein